MAVKTPLVVMSLPTIFLRHFYSRGKLTSSSSWWLAGVHRNCPDFFLFVYIFFLRASMGALEREKDSFYIFLYTLLIRP